MTYSCEKRLITTSFVISLFIISVFSSTIFMNNGFANRVSQIENYKFIITAPNKDNFCTEKFDSFSEFDYCRLSRQSNEPQMLLLGDSHSHALYEALAARYPDKSILHIGQTSCAPFANDELFENSHCSNFQKKLVDFLDSNSTIENIVLAGYWGYLASGKIISFKDGYRLSDNISEKDADSFLLNADNILRVMRNARLFIIEDNPDLNFAANRCIDIGMSRKILKKCTMEYSAYEPRKKQVDSLIAHLIESNPFLNYIKTEAIFCNDKVCSSQRGNMTLYSDSDHLSYIGAEFVINELDKVLSK
jgi:hypothetical protein